MATTPADAPVVIPIISGLAKALWVVVWKIAPEMARAAPAPRATNALGNRNCSKINSSYWLPSPA
ncbi:hypothetical protein YPPY102_1827, partial [Yersinia pestis PY-102]